MNPEPLHFRALAAAVLLIGAVALVAYYNAFSGVLVFDDFPALRDNATIRSLWPIGKTLSPPHDSGLGGRPVANLSFALNYALSGDSARGFHAGNLLLHLGSALLLFGIVRRTVRARRVAMGAAVAAIWVAHPLTTAAVTYLSQRTELGMGFFALLTLYAFVRRSAGGGAPWLVVSAAAAVLGTLSKETMVVIPVIVFLYDRAFVAGSFRAAWRARPAYYLALAATWLVLAALMATSHLAQRSVGYGLGVSPFSYALTEARAIFLYLKLALWPWPLVFDYGAVYAVSTISAAVGVALILAALTVTVLLLRRNTAAGFLAAGFFLLLAPTSSIVPVAEQPIAENRMYLPLALVVAGIAAGAHATLGRRSLAVAGVVLPALMAATSARNESYRSEVALWSDTVQKRPQNPRAHFNHGVALLDSGQPAAAAERFATAIRLKPTEVKAHNSLGNALLALGRPAEAAPHFAEAIRLQPDFARAWGNLGLALFRTGDAAGAIRHLEHALRLDAKLTEAHHALGNAHFSQDRPAEAVMCYEAALRLDPKLADAHYNCGSACLELNRIADAILHFASAARLKPDDAEIRNNHGAALLRAGRVQDAIAELSAALRLKPDYPAARENLVLAQAELNRAK